MWSKPKKARWENDSNSIMNDVLIIGCGISGATIARNLADSQKAKNIVIIDKRSFVGGNCYDYKNNNVLVQKYGAHIFHTDEKRVWSFVRRFSRFNEYMHRVVALIDGKLVSIPFNLESLYTLFPGSAAENFQKKLLSRFKYGAKISILDFMRTKDVDLKFLANYIYENVFLQYTKKQWGTAPDTLDPSVLSRVPVFISFDNRYFQDKFQGMPLNGYTRMIEAMLDHKNIKVRLNTNYTKLHGKFDKIFATCPIDEYFDFEFGMLPYRSVCFEFEKYKTEWYQKNSVINYPNNYDFTRTIEFKHFYPYQKFGQTVIAKEYPQEFTFGLNEAIYPIRNSESETIYEKYLKRAAEAKITFFGRLGDFRYYNMDTAIERAINIVDQLE
jgi:UDP-galactopyranose mutase